MGHTRSLSPSWAWLATVIFPVSVIKDHDISNLRKGLCWFTFKGAVLPGGEVMVMRPQGKNIILHTQPRQREVNAGA